MAYLDDRISLMQTPRYWTAALYQISLNSGGKYVNKGYLPVKLEKWGAFQQRLPMGEGIITYPFYWDGQKWVRDVASPGAPRRVSGDEPQPPAALSSGKIERRNPLPPGRYWQDIIGQKAARAWDLWAAPKVKDGSVVIEKWEHFRADPVSGGGWLGDLNKAGLIPDFLTPENPAHIPVRNWMLFVVKRPVMWPQAELGFPTVAGSEIQQSADTAQVPEVPTIIEEIGDDIKNKIVMPVVAVVAIYLGAKIFFSLRD